MTNHGHMYARGNGATEKGSPNMHSILKYIKLSRRQSWFVIFFHSVPLKSEFVNTGVDGSEEKPKRSDTPKAIIWPWRNSMSQFWVLHVSPFQFMIQHSETVTITVTVTISYAFQYVNCTKTNEILNTFSLLKSLKNWSNTRYINNWYHETSWKCQR